MCDFSPVPVQSTLFTPWTITTSITIPAPGSSPSEIRGDLLDVTLVFSDEEQAKATLIKYNVPQAQKWEWSKCREHFLARKAGSFP